MCFKTISIVPVPKHSPPTYLNNCHPVELRPIVMTFLEQLLMAQLKTCLLPSDLQLSWVPWTAGVSWVLPSVPLALGRVALLHYYPIFIITLFFKYRHGSGSYHPAFWVYGVFHVCVLLWCLPVPCGVLMFIHLLCVFSLSVFIHFSSVHPTLSCFQVYEMMLLQVFMFQVSMFMSPFLKIKLGFCLSALGSTRSLHKVSFSPTVTVTVKKYYRVCGLPEWRWWLRWHWSVSPPSWRLSERWRTNLLAHLAEDPENAQLVWVGTPAHLSSSVKELPCCRYGWEVRKHWDKKVG